MSDCCSPSYQNTFDTQRATKELEEYHQKGVKKSSRSMAESLQKLPLQKASMLEIGGGIGAIIFESIKRGVQKAMHIDISSAYSQAFMAETNRMGMSEKIESLTGDFMDHHPTIPSSDLVVLDKVICCYKDYQSLITASLSKANKWYAYTIPRDVWWVKWVHGTEQFFNQFKKNPFLSYIHPADSIEKIIGDHGFLKMSTVNRREWQTVVFEKNAI